VERWILARLRDRQFFSLAELNAAIEELLIELNERAFQKLDGSRRSRFIELEQLALKALPARAYEYAQWKCAKVHPDYHIEVEHAYYSVPYKHIGARVEARISARMIEIFLKRQLIASHPRLFKRGARSTLDAHRPANHRAVIDTTVERLLARAAAIAPSVAQVLTEQFNRKRHPKEALRLAQGILRLAEDFSPQQLAAACERAVKLNACNYRSVRALIAAPPTEPGESRQLSLVHENVRGSDYFH
jgi:transposase